MDDALLFDVFPQQLFPDIELAALRLDDEALRVVCTESEWALQSDIPLVSGAGTMVFFYQGQARVGRHDLGQPPALSPVDPGDLTLPAIESLLLIERDETAWYFHCRLADASQRFVIGIPVNGIEWQPGELALSQR
ncbi:hypothetical protein [Modicisalibacter sp. MOD 31.J]|uniref:hypothetical protein n=1 Tax=Modicisalibacter sp. MOD 31.J TaxID=2831897 RepID=UPI001CD03810|nr:hypothetical protein [Modicisalibacter sp. MOD 31.J]MBZ9576360.1 hypothetical protein [Modicisalibacter sp. MOD 31.J]